VRLVQKPTAPTQLQTQ